MIGKIKKSEIFGRKNMNIRKRERAKRASGNFSIFNEKYHLKWLEKYKKFRFSVEKIWTFSKNFGVFFTKICLKTKGKMKKIVKYSKEIRRMFSKREGTF